jgi:hypothetical protein
MPMPRVTRLTIVDMPSNSDSTGGATPTAASSRSTACRDGSPAGAASQGSCRRARRSTGPLALAAGCARGTTSDEGLAAVLLHKYGVGVLPGSAFGEESGRLRLRVATSMLYGDTDTERMAALSSADPCSLPWIAASLARLEEALAGLTG